MSDQPDNADGAGGLDNPGNPFAGMPYLRRTQVDISARTWNAWRRWRKRFGARLEMPVQARPGTALLATEEFWVFIDMTQGGVPLIVWFDFDEAARGAALHAEVPCIAQFHDYPGARFHDAVLDEMTTYMEDALKSPA